MMDPLFCLCGSPALFARLFLTLSFSLSFCVSLWPPPFLSVSPLSVHFTLSPGPPPASLLILEHFQFISLYITSFNGFFISVVMMMPISACSSRRRAPADQPLGNVSFFFSSFHLVPSFTAPRRDAARSHGSPIRGPFYREAVALIGRSRSATVQWTSVRRSLFALQSSGSSRMSNEWLLFWY